jgi:hypothetical protein
LNERNESNYVVEIIIIIIGKDTISFMQGIYIIIIIIISHPNNIGCEVKCMFISVIFVVTGIVTNSLKKSLDAIQRNIQLIH